MYGQLAAARLLLDRGADVNHRGGYGRTPLLYAATKSASQCTSTSTPTRAPVWM